MTIEEQNTRLGEIIKAHRNKRKMSREALAALTGLAKSHIWRIETGKTNPTVHSISIICDVLELPITEVFRPKTESTFTDDEFIRLYMSKSQETKNRIQTIFRWI